MTTLAPSVPAPLPTTGLDEGPEMDWTVVVPCVIFVVTAFVVSSASARLKYAQRDKTEGTVALAQRPRVTEAKAFWPAPPLAAPCSTSFLTSFARILASPSLQQWDFFPVGRTLGTSALACPRPSSLLGRTTHSLTRSSDSRSLQVLWRVPSSWCSQER